MATHTDSGNGAFGRKFSIGRENGQLQKDGRPYFFEWVKEVPADKGKRKFETRTGKNGAKHYELFSAIDGYLLDVRSEQKDLGKGNETWLVLQMNDATDEYTVEVGRIDSQYSTDLLRRLLNPYFNPNHKLRLSPYAITDGDRQNIGVTAYSGADALKYKMDSDFLAGCPKGESREWKGKIEWDFSGVAQWLLDQVRAKVVPKLMKDPISAPVNGNAKQVAVPSENDFPTQDITSYPENGNGDDLDLPF